MTLHSASKKTTKAFDEAISAYRKHVGAIVNKMKHGQRRAGLVLAHGAGSEHGEVQMKVLETIQNRRIEWEIISTHPQRSPASAWTGTRILFEITERENPGHWLGIDDGGPRLAVLEFRHSGWNEGSEYFGVCNFASGETLLTLKRWCESRNA